MTNNNLKKSVGFGDIQKIFEKVNRIVLTVHVHPDGDALGSMLALYEYLKNMGKDVQMAVDDQIPEKFKVLPNISGIVTPKDIIQPEKVDLLVVLDASSFERIGRVGEVVKAPILNIDHHISNTLFADYIYLDAKAAATGEIMAQYLQEVSGGISAETANALYMAIATDCGFFKFENTTEHTMQMAGYCVSHGAKPQEISNIVDVSTKERLEAMKGALETVEFFCDGKVAKIEVNHLLLQLVQDDTDGFVDLIRNIEGVDVAILFKEYTSKQTRVSFRSKISDVNAIAARFDGGGHVRAAGCTVKLPLREAVTKVMEVMKGIM